ncbi:type 1 fimbrial protein [Salmonella enterica]
MKKKAIFLVAALAVVNSFTLPVSAAAGTQTFTASISDSTCVIDDLNKTVSLGDFSNTEFTSAMGAKVSNFFVDSGFSVTGCPNTIKTVSVTPSFDTGGAEMVVKNNGTFAATFNTNISIDNKVDDKAQWSNGVNKSFTLENGAAIIPVTGKLYTGMAHTPGNAKEGTLSYVMSFVFDFA